MGDIFQGLSGIALDQQLLQADYGPFALVASMMRIDLQLRRHLACPEGVRLKERVREWSPIPCLE